MSENITYKGKFIFACIVSFIVSCVFLFKGYDKITNYANFESSVLDSVNVYVGGDAYNYIINANYATGYFVLATLFVIIGIGLIIIGIQVDNYIINKDKATQKLIWNVKKVISIEHDKFDEELLKAIKEIQKDNHVIRDIQITNLVGYSNNAKEAYIILESR